MIGLALLWSAVCFADNDTIPQKKGLMRKTLEEITSATDEGAMGATDIAQKIVDITGKAEDVLERAATNKASAEKLDNMVDFFKI